MSKRPGATLKKVTLNLYEDDVQRMAKLYGFGWSEVVRDLVYDHLHKKRTLIELVEDHQNERN